MTDPTTAPILPSAREVFRQARAFEEAALRAELKIDIPEARRLAFIAAQLYKVAGDLLPDSKRAQAQVINLQGLEIYAAARELQTPEERVRAIESRRAGDEAVEAMHRRRERAVRAELAAIGLSEAQIGSALTRLIASPRFVRVRVEDATGQSFFGLPTANPAVAVPNLGKTGWCEQNAFCPELGRNNPRITLDDGAVIWGYQCWWTEIEDGASPG
jgi:hypothetical protein